MSRAPMDSLVRAEAAEIDLFISLADDENLTDDYIDAYIDEMRRQCYKPSLTGARLKWIRESLGLTQKEVAAAMGVAYQTICVWERGKADITLRDAYRLMSLYRRLADGTDTILLYSTLDAISG